MYDKVNYILDNQTYLYELFSESERGRHFLEYNMFFFVLCVCMFASAIIILCLTKAAAVPRPVAIEPRSAQLKAAVVFSMVFSVFLFMIREQVSFEYMDFSYFYEGEFNSFNDFIANKVYLSNIHRPGYLLISWLFRELLGGAREAYIILNLVALIATVPLAFRLLDRNISPASSLSATVAFIISPLTVYSAFRLSPYTIIVFLFVLMAYSYVSFCETGEKKHAAAMAAAVFLLPFFHVLTSVGIAAFFTAAALCKKQFMKHGGYAALLFFAVVVAALGACLFNLSHLLLFRSEIEAISVPSTTRLNVYPQFSGGNVEFIYFCLKIIPNLYTSFISESPYTAVIAGVLFMAGGAGLCMRGRHGLLFVLLGLASGAVLIATNSLNNKQFGGYPMSYRHLHMIGFFFLYPVFFACDRIGQALSSRLEVARSSFCLLLLFVFTIHLPGLLNKLREPDMMRSMKYVYDNAAKYDGVIPGNSYFMNEFHTHLLTDDRYGYDIRSADSGGESLPEITIRNFNQWIILKKTDGDAVQNIMLNIAPFSIDSYSDLLKNNFIHRVWYLDNDTRFLGRLPDFSGEYEKGIREALNAARPLEIRNFKGVTVHLYEVEHPPIYPDEEGVFTIAAGENDYYFVGGAIPDTRVYSASRAITENTYVLFFVPPGLDAVRIELVLDESPDESGLIIREIESGASCRPTNSDRFRPVYLVRRHPASRHFLLGFEQFGHAVYREIKIAGTNDTGECQPPERDQGNASDD